MSIQPTNQRVVPQPGVPARAKDASARRALAALDETPGPVSGAALARAIGRGIADYDAHGASVEYRTSPVGRTPTPAD